MISDIHPDTSIVYPSTEEGRDNTPITGFYLGKMFIPMKPHRGHVGLVPTRSGKGCGYRLLKQGNNKQELYGSCYFTLRVRSINESRTENEVFQIAASEGHRLVVTFDKKENESS
jgi:hypothetical protein